MVPKIGFWHWSVTKTVEIAAKKAAPKVMNRLLIHQRLFVEFVLIDHKKDCSSSVHNNESVWRLHLLPPAFSINKRVRQPVDSFLLIASQAIPFITNARHFRPFELIEPVALICF